MPFTLVLQTWVKPRVKLLSTWAQPNDGQRQINKVSMLKFYYFRYWIFRDRVKCPIDLSIKLKGSIF